MIGWGLMDIASILVIVWFIGLTYYKRYKDTGYLYVKTQLELISAYCISLVVNLYAYYWAEERFNIDEKYTKGIILTFPVLGFLVNISSNIGLFFAYTSCNFFLIDSPK